MQVTTIHYERKRSDGEYGNRAVSLSATVDEQESIHDAVRRLRHIANLMLDEEERLERERREREEQEMRAQYERRRAERSAALAAQGDGEDDDDDLPY